MSWRIVWNWPHWLRRILCCFGVHSDRYGITVHYVWVKKGWFYARSGHSGRGVHTRTRRHIVRCETCDARLPRYASRQLDS